MNFFSVAVLIGCVVGLLVLVLLSYRLTGRRQKHPLLPLPPVSVAVLQCCLAGKEDYKLDQSEEVLDADLTEDTPSLEDQVSALLGDEAAITAEADVPSIWGSTPVVPPLPPAYRGSPLIGEAMQRVMDGETIVLDCSEAGVEVISHGDLSKLADCLPGGNCFAMLQIRGVNAWAGRAVSRFSSEALQQMQATGSYGHKDDARESVVLPPAQVKL